MPYVKIYYNTNDRDKIAEFRQCLGIKSESNVNGLQVIYVQQKNLSKLHEYQLNGTIQVRQTL